MPDIFGVIADATRRDILQVLLERHVQDSEISVSEIVSQLEMSQPTVSKHLKVLYMVDTTFYTECMVHILQYLILAAK